MLGDVILENRKEHTPLLQKSSSISSTSTDDEVCYYKIYHKIDCCCMLCLKAVL
jgi:hypothetical protein